MVNGAHSARLPSHSNQDIPKALKISLANVYIHECEHALKIKPITTEKAFS